MSGISIILVILVAFLAGVEGILDEFEFHQPLVACTLIGIVTGQLGPCLVLAGLTLVQLYLRMLLSHLLLPQSSLSSAVRAMPA